MFGRGFARKGVGSGLAGEPLDNPSRYCQADRSAKPGRRRRSPPFSADSCARMPAQVMFAA